MAKAKAATTPISIRPVQMLPFEQLVPNPDNPKKPLGVRYKRGLKASLAKYGFSEVFVVAPNDDGTYTILNGNTRQDELDASGVSGDVPCVVMDDLDTPEKRRLFVLTFDRHKKLFDEEAVITQLRDLHDAGMPVAELQTLAGIENLTAVIDSVNKQSDKVTEAAQKLRNEGPQASMTLYGPAEDIDAIKSLVKQIRYRASGVEKIKTILEQMEDNFDWNDELSLSVLLAVLARYQELLELK